MGRRLAIIGAGFSGTLLALHVLRRAPAGTTVVLIERGRRFGRGHAYATGNPNHLLNVPAGRMSAYHDRPADFLDWLKARPDIDATPGCFVPRQVFGSYIRDLLKSEIRDPDRRNRLQLIRGMAVSVAPTASTLTLQLDRARALEADVVVLATGNLAPTPPPVSDDAFYCSPLYHPDPWATDALDGLDRDEPVLLIGTGLTAVDVVTSLLDRDHRGVITALSRRGLMPLQHVAAGAPTASAARMATPLASARSPIPTQPLKLLRQLRARARAHQAQGGSWQTAIDEMRPWTHDVWQSMTLDDRRAFLRHLRPWWDVHRHRMAPSVAARVHQAGQDRQLFLRAGRIQRFAVHGTSRVDVHFRRHPRHGGGDDVVSAGRVINCSGPTADYSHTSDPLLRFLLETGQARPDTLRLGLDVTATCALRAASGAVSRQLFAVGPITKGTFWEMTAIPDLRRQCEALATHLAGLLSAL